MRTPLGWITLCLIALLIVLCCVYLFGPLLRARYLFHEVQTLQVNRSTLKDAQRLAEKLGATSFGPCSPSDCRWSAEVTNARLPRWWRGSGATFAVQFFIKDSIVVYQGAWYAIGTDPYGFTPSIASVGIKEKWLELRGGYRVVIEPPMEKSWRIGYFERNNHREVADARFEVHMTPRTSAEDKKRYTAFDYSCLWKYKGCKDATELLPTADPFPTDQ